MDSVQDQANQRIKAVQDAFDRAMGEWSGVMATAGSFLTNFSFDGPQQQALGALRKQMDLSVAPWVKRAYTLAPNDKPAWDKWIDEGNAILQAMRDQAQFADSTKLDRMVVGTVVETAADIKEGAEVVAETAMTAVKWAAWVVPALIVIAVFIWWKWLR